MSTAPTCEEEGELLFTCTACGVTRTETIPALGHEWGMPEYTWADDYSALTATRVCAADPEHVETETVAAELWDTVPASCLEAGIHYYGSQSFENSGFTEQELYVFDIPPLGHDWSLSYEVYPPTCEEDGLEVYECANCGEEKFEPIPALGHDWDRSAVTYTWSADHSTVLAAASVCSRDEDHMRTERAEAVYSVSAAPTCYSPGIGVWTAPFTEDPFEEQVLAVALPAVGHDWNAPSYIWSGDNSAVTARTVCKNDASHIAEETAATTYEVVTPPTADATGVGTYTVVFTDPRFASQSRDVEIPRLSVYTVTFDADGGWPVPERQLVVHGSTASEPAVPGKAGYRLLGWYNGEEAYDFTAPVTADLNLKAKWMLKPYTITVSTGMGGGATIPPSKYAEAGETITVLAGPESDSWMLDRITWTPEGGTATDITATQRFIMPAKNVTVTVTFKRVTHTVSFSANGGAGSMTAQTVNRGWSFILPSCGFTAPDGKQFDVWEIDGTAYAPGESITVNGNVTAAARWKDLPAASYTVTVNTGTGGSAGTSVSSAAAGKTVTVTATPAAGYALEKITWKPEGGSTEDITSAKQFTMPEKNVTVNVTFRRLTCAVSFAANGGSGSMTAQEVSYGSSYILPSCGFTAPEGQQFEGWKVGILKCAPNDIITVSGDTTVTAMWKDLPAATYTVTVSGSAGGSASASASSATAGTVVTVSVTPAAGYALEKITWTPEGETTGDITSARQFTMPEKNVTVNVTFRQITYTVTFDADGGSPVPAVQTVAHGSAAAKPADPAREGYDFGGWYSGSAAYDFAAPVTGALNLKAKWTRKTYTAAFEANGGGGSMASQTVSHGDSFILPSCGFTAPAGQQFDSWELGGVKRAPGDSVTVTGNVTVKATWKELPPALYTVTVNGGTGGSASASASSATAGMVVTVSVTPAAGYALEKITWTPEGETTGDITSARQFTMPEKNVTVNVVFRKLPPLITGEVNGNTIAYTLREVPDGA